METADDVTDRPREAASPLNIAVLDDGEATRKLGKMDTPPVILHEN
jgi:hypothetical protein